jgi:hypothetical protein
MKPLVYSVKRNGGWTRSGKNIYYFQNNVKKQGEAGFYNTLTFELEFEHEFDTVFIAYTYPYTFSDLSRYLKTILNTEKYNLVLGSKVLCKSINGNECKMLVVTDFTGTEIEIAAREAIFITARVHPGENPCSFVMEGLINFLISSDSKAQFLRKNFIFKIVPMLNIDGVVIGNTRTNMAGLDLNRQYRDPEGPCPEITALKNEFFQTQSSRKINMFLDIHGHSQNKNLFIFGCSNNNYPEHVMKERIFPLIAHQNIDSFYFDSCKFNIEQSKFSTGRISVRELFGIINSFTFEISVCGAAVGKKKGNHYTIPDLLSIGHDLGRCLYIMNADKGAV